MGQNKLLHALALLVAALCGPGTAAEDIIDLSGTPVLCNQLQFFTLKEVLPDGYAYYYNNDSTEIVLTRDSSNPNRYSSRFPQAPYIHSCDYIVKKLGDTVTMIACLEQYQEENPYYVVFAADSREQHAKQWHERINSGNHDWVFDTPIDDDMVIDLGIEQLEQLLARLKQSGQHNALVDFNITRLTNIIASMQSYE